jgi:DNA-binding transcriptional MerR regulator
MNKFWTIGRIVMESGVAIHRVLYYIESRGIKPCGRAGGARVFAEGDALAIVAALRQRGRLPRPEGERRA